MKKRIENRFICGDCIKEMQQFPEDSIDLVFGSPPYEDARTYGIDFNLKGQDWVDWMIEVYRESSRVCKGLVAFVIQGRTRKYKWSATPALLMADLHRAGFNLRDPIIYHRIGIPGSGGPDWLRHDCEYVLCVTKKSKLFWSDNTAMGCSPKWQPGGIPSYRTKSGRRVNRLHTKTMKNGKKKIQGYCPPQKVNPGNLIQGHGGGGHLGSKLAHKNEAPFPEKLAEFFVKSFCPPEGMVLDPFSGSGTTCVVAERLNRNWVGIDIRLSQIELGQRRMLGVKNKKRKSFGLS